ncbi:MAG: FGGY-family carbohydrate kinase [Acetobacter sp.]|nr:FGGY-family carbohydrate kinase [Bacteroides sp.]MCM1342195.1 FGGY-family carbohydrate kinase [Acetobacter sp.]MCM1434407.1 FGGY-family carbohydrate kinase [Clostridiales bacterium]
MSNYSLNGNETLGIEFGSTRIKAVLIDESCNPIATGGHNWENRFENGIWTYHIDDIWSGLQDAYSKLNDDCEKKFGSKIKKLASVGFSAMMHGYLPFDKDGNLLTPFRTWRNTITVEASAKLTKAFNFNIPQRWSIAHLYQAVLNNEDHINNIDFLTTLEGYVHWKLSGMKVIGIGEASGMFPIDSSNNCYNKQMIDIFNSLDEVKKCSWNIEDILPKILVAGEQAGTLTDYGAKLLDPTGNLQSGAVMCAPEGDAGTGMVATNSVTEKTGNISAGTSIFSMVVLEEQLNNVYEEIDMVTTPTGKPVAMVHCNNCCTDLDYWVNLFAEFSSISGGKLSKPQIYDLLYNEALKGDSDCGGLVSYNYFSGEPVTKLEHGRPLFARSENAVFNLANFFRTNIYSAIAALKIGMEILEKENVTIDCLTGHGGLFKTEIVGQKLMAGALNTPVSVMETAGEGGAWGIAVLARFVVDSNAMTLEEYLNKIVFSKYKSTTINPDIDDVEGFKKYMLLYKKGLAVEKAAAENI